MEENNNLPSKELPIKPLTRAELAEDAKKRLSLIGTEFSRGFEFLKNYPKSVTFFGSARLDKEDPYCKKAESLAGHIVKELNYSIVTGGGPGIMEAANKGAHEMGGTAVGLNIKLPKEQRVNSYVTDSINFYYFFVRKVCLSFSAEAYIFFPGGFGTLDEMFEILTLVQTKKIEKVPIILVGKEYWEPLEQFLKEKVLETKMIEEEDLTLYTITDNEDEIIEIIRKSPIQEGVPYGSHHRKNKGNFFFFD